jgi:hypothetical protein
MRAEQQAEELRQGFIKELQVTREKIEVTRQGILETLRRDLETTRRDFEAQLAAVDARTRHIDTGIAVTNAGNLKRQKFDGTTSWAVFHHQFEAATNNNG